MGEEWKNLWPCFNMTTGGIDADETYNPTSYLSRSLSILKTRCLDINFSPLDHPNLSYPYILHSENVDFFPVISFLFLSFSKYIQSNIKHCFLCV